MKKRPSYSLLVQGSAYPYKALPTRTRLCLPVQGSAYLAYMSPQ